MYSQRDHLKMFPKLSVYKSVNSFVNLKWFRGPSDLSPAGVGRVAKSPHLKALHLLSFHCFLRRWFKALVALLPNICRKLKLNDRVQVSTYTIVLQPRWLGIIKWKLWSEQCNFSITHQRKSLTFFHYVFVFTFHTIHFWDSYLKNSLLEVYRYIKQGNCAIVGGYLLIRLRRDYIREKIQITISKSELFLLFFYINVVKHR